MSDTPFFSEANVRSPDYFVARAQERCWYCGRSTSVLALALPPHHETHEHSDIDSGVWQRATGGALVFYVADLPDEVQARILGFSACFRLVRSPKTMTAYWANHCEYCSGLLDDHELHCEPDGAFVPLGEAAARAIKFITIHEGFEAVAAGYALEPAFLSFLGTV